MDNFQKTLNVCLYQSNFSENTELKTIIHDIQNVITLLIIVRVQGRPHTKLDAYIYTETTYLVHAYCTV
jgi:hypothetical protein